MTTSQADSHVIAYHLHLAAVRRRQNDIARGDRQFDKFEHLARFGRLTRPSVATTAA